MSDKKTQSALKYVLLPEVWPRFLALITSTFSLAAYSVACIFYAVRLLPANHGYVNPANIGQFGIRHVLVAAGRHLTFSWRHLDQIIIYALIVSGVFILFSQFALMGVAVVSHQPAVAGILEDTFSRTDQQHYQDLVMVVMDRVFGVPGIFNSCISVADQACTDMYNNPTADFKDQFPFSFHEALHDMLEFYSNGMFFIAVFIILYFVTVLVSETAASGSPFGQRYNKTWIPVRIILFFALLVPINASSTTQDSDEIKRVNGLNAAQLLTLWVAKTGSDFASNGWDTFHTNLSSAYLAGSYKLVAETNVPSFDDLFQFVFLARSCKIATEYQYNPTSEWIQPYIVRNDLPFDVDTLSVATAANFLDTSYADAVAMSAKSSVRIAFGPLVQDENDPYYAQAVKKPGSVLPLCGTLEIPSLGKKSTTEQMLPGEQVQQLYYNLLQTLWKDSDVIHMSYCVASNYFEGLSVASSYKQCPDIDVLKNTILVNKMHDYREKTAENYRALIDAHNASGDAWNLSEYMKSKGWAGAALWYNQIADMNGQVSEAILNLPKVTAYPVVQEYVAAEKKKISENVSAQDIYKPEPYMRFLENPKDEKIAYSLYSVFSFFNIENNFATATGPQRNFIYEAIDLIFGAGGLYDIRRNADVNPLAQLSALGKGIMDSAIRNIGLGSAGSLMSRLFQDIPDQSVGVVSGAVQQIGYAAIVIGFGLYYILPLMPFVYFFFAFSGWVKSIFEAIVAVPLWAVAHITRWDGEGIAGPAAKDGYFLLFEIFLRPIMILFGLLASISIFSALVMVLNEIFDAVVANVSGASGEFLSIDSVEDVLNAQSGIDEFFYTIIYTVLCYMIGLSSFKLIDAIPNQILRWMGFSVKTFQEDNPGAAEELSGKAYQGMTISTSKLSGMTLKDSEYAGLF